MTIHIKPENRGKFTALKKRTGKSASWFKAHGTPAQRKMATFALNAKHWKHSDGGNLFTEDVNLFAYGAPIRDYGMEWNNKVDRLRALNSIISQIGQKVDSMSSGAGGFGGISEGSAGWGNVGKTPEGLTGNDAIASQSFAANEFGFADGGTLGGYSVPQQKSGLENLMHGFGVDKNTLNDIGSWMSSAEGQNAIANFGENFKGFKDMFAGGKKACGGKLAYGGSFPEIRSLGDVDVHAAARPYKCGGKLHCGGGNLFDYGGDFSNGLTFYNNGGTHEENPNEGVQVGVDDQGTPNLVEEGEVRYQDYIFSNRLSLDKEMAKKYNIPKKYADATFAYIAEKMGEESKEREYDPISQRGLRADMEKLRGAQEEVKAIKAQEEMMQQVQQIADELGVAPEDVLTAMQMQQQDQQQQASPVEQMMMQQQEEIPQEEVSEEEMQEMPYALGGTLFDYAGMNFSVPQKSQQLNNSLPNKLALGDDVNDPWYSKFNPYQYSNADLTSWRYGDGISWVNPYGKPGYIATIPSADDRHYKYPSTAEKEEAMDIYKQFTEAILNDPKLREWYFKQYDANTPGKSVKTKFYDKNGNLRPDWKEHFLELRNDNKIGPMHNIAGRVGNRYYYMKDGKPVYVDPNDDYSNYIIRNKGYVADGINGWNDYEITSAQKVPEVNAPSAPAVVQKSPTIPVATEQSPTTSSNNPQSQEQSTGEQPKVYNTTPNYSMLDFVPLWQYLAAGKPDYYQADALVDYTNRMPKPTYKPIGDFVQYHPFDRQYAANQLRAQTAAAMRNKVNMSAGNRGYAGDMNLATNMQAQLTDAAMQRQADETNLAQRLQAAQFNRGTNQFNAEAFNRLELQRPYQYQLGLQARAQRAHLHNAIDNAYSSAKSTNLNTFLNNMYNRRREAQDAARTKWMIDAGIFGDVSDPGYPYPINGNSYLDWYNIPWNRFAKRTKKDTNE